MAGLVQWAGWWGTFWCQWSGSVQGWGRASEQRGADFVGVDGRKTGLCDWYPSNNSTGFRDLAELFSIGWVNRALHLCARACVPLWPTQLPGDCSECNVDLCTTVPRPRLQQESMFHDQAPLEDFLGYVSDIGHSLGQAKSPWKWISTRWFGYWNSNAPPFAHIFVHTCQWTSTYIRTMGGHSPPAYSGCLVISVTPRYHSEDYNYFLEQLLRLTLTLSWTMQIQHVREFFWVESIWVLYTPRAACGRRKVGHQGVLEAEHLDTRGSLASTYRISMQTPAYMRVEMHARWKEAGWFNVYLPKHESERCRI